MFCMSHVTCHMSSVTCHMLRVTCHIPLTSTAIATDPLYANSPTRHVRVVRKKAKKFVLQKPNIKTTPFDQRYLVHQEVPFPRRDRQTYKQTDIVKESD